MEPSRKNFIRTLQNAYSGEMAAAYAYRGQWRSLKDPTEREHVKRIEAEEWDHRRRVGEWLVRLDSRPRAVRERICWAMGHTVGLASYISGWFMPMYFAGRVESKNSIEYEDAAEMAKGLELHDCADDLLDMARGELEHEVYFRETVTGHRLLPLMKRMFGWS